MNIIKWIGGAALWIIAFAAAVGVVVITIDSKRKRNGRKEEQEKLPARQPKAVYDTKTKMYHLREKLLQTERELWEIQALTPYGRFFERTVMPIQTLLGLANVSPDTLSKDNMDYYMWDVIAEQLILAIRNARGTIANGILTLPEPEEAFAQEEIRNRINRMEEQELERDIQENEARIRSARITVQKAQVIRGLGSIVEELQRINRDEPVKEADVRRLAGKAQLLLEKNEIYPMSARDDRLKPELKKRFVQPGQYSIKYPGLFIKWGDEWEVLGSYVGMDDREV